MENTEYANIDWSDLIQKAISLISNSVSSIVDKAVDAVVTLGNGVFDAVLSIVFALYCL